MLSYAIVHSTFEFTLYIRLIGYTTFFLRFNQPGTTMSPSSRFMLCLSLDGQHSWNRLQVLKNEAIATCTLSQWAGMLQVMALSSLVKRTVFSVYPDVSDGICPLFHGPILLWGNYFQYQHVMTPVHCILCGPGMVASITSHAFHFGQTILSLSVMEFPTSTHSMYFLRHVPHLQCLSPHLIISYQVVLLLLATPSGLIQVHFIFASHLLVAFPVNLHLHPFQIPVHLQDLQWFLLQSSFHKPCMAQLPLSLQAPSPLSFLLHVPHL